MRRAFSERVERGRHLSGSPYATVRGDLDGAFMLRTNGGIDLKVLVSQGSEEIPWEHVSVSLARGVARCPTWEEMCWVKSLFFEDEECAVQYHPPASEYVNQHRFCLHLFRPLSGDIPRPPSITLGERGGPVLR